LRSLAGGVDVVQIREKALDHSDLRRLCRQVLEAGADPARIMVNGSPAIASKLGIGLHLSETAGRPAQADAAQIGLIARSVHSAESAETSSWVDFVIAGHIFESRSKPGMRPIGPSGLAAIVQKAPVPVIAIGGITPENVSAVMSTGASGVAVLSAINDVVDPETAARTLKRSLENCMSDQTETIDVTVNGKPATISVATSVHDYLAQRGFHERMVVVELNGEILKKSAFATTPISAGDRIEIVHFVGGG
jgi:thiamine biosynthesis protein ThiS